jgi:UDP-glucose 4-epimerase
VLEPGTAGETYNVGADQPVPVLELAEIIANAFEVRCRVEHLPARNEVAHAFSDHSKIRAALALGEPIDLRTGIGRMAEWVRAHGPRDPVEFRGEIELPRNMPPSWIAGDRSQSPPDSSRDDEDQ